MDINKKLDTVLNESGLSRVYEHTQRHDYGTISAFRYAPDCGAGKPYTRQQNMQRTRSLLAKLRALGYGVTAIKGKFREGEGREVSEESFLVVDMQDKGNLRSHLLALGEEFEQDSVVYGNPRDGAWLVGTNHCPKGSDMPEYGQQKHIGDLTLGKSGMFYSSVRGRPFVIEDFVEYGVLKYPTELRSVVSEAQKHWADLGE